MADIACIYHAGCADGFTAAWALRQGLADWEVEFHPGTYQEPPPDVTDKLVYLVDFSYKRPEMEALLEQAFDVVVLDHHKTAEEELRPLLFDGGALKGVIDQTRSGARIAWDWFFPDEEPPTILKIVEDRDLWRFRYSDTEPVMAAVHSLPQEFEVWDWLMEGVEYHDLVRQGAAIRRAHDKHLQEFLDHGLQTIEILGHQVPAVNLPYFFASDAGHILAEGAPFAATYWDTPEGRTFSLRSDERGLDVSEVAKQFGGGGHRNAAGFRVPPDHPLAGRIPVQAGELAG